MKKLAWHFIKPDKRERFEPHRKIIVGKTLSCDPDKLDMCNYGLHASVNPLDALQYLEWDDAIICRVELSGKMIIGDDKICAENRKVLWMGKCDKTLHEFAIWCAEQCLHEFEKKYPDDLRPRQAIEAKRKWLKGEISNEDLDAARSAASDAAGSAAGSAAWSAARSAARSAQNKQLTKMLNKLKP
jgi:hypothetical protein